MKRFFCLLIGVLVLLLSACAKEPSVETLPAESVAETTVPVETEPELAYVTAQVNGVPAVLKTFSRDGGRTWSDPEPLDAEDVSGSPPHLFRHSSGAIILTYGRRTEPFGQRALISRDNGETWEDEYILRDDGPDHDLGYPSTVELPDGSLLTVYYQKVTGDRACSLLWTRWQL